MLQDTRITEHYHKRLASYLSNTPPEALGAERLQQVLQLKQLAKILRFSPSSIKDLLLANLRESSSASIPSEFQEDQKEELFKEMLAMYSNPDELEKYVSDDVFHSTFRNNISYLVVCQKTPAFIGDSIDVDSFIRTPMQEPTTNDNRKLSKICKKKNSRSL